MSPCIVGTGLTLSWHPRDTSIIPVTTDADTAGEFKNHARFERTGAPFQVRKSISPAVSDTTDATDANVTYDTKTLLQPQQRRQP
jgi:hypothetical protein